MSLTNETDLQFSFTFYYYVRYLGHCEDVPDPGKYGKPLVIPEKLQQIPIICLSLIAFIVNAISLFLFLFGEATLNLIVSLRGTKTTTLATTTTTSAVTTAPTKNLTKGSKERRRPRSLFLTSLIILSTFEVIFNLNVFILKLTQVLSPYFIHQRPVNPASHIPPDMRLVVIPTAQNVIMFLAETGLMCRNWCICLITAARAEVVMWPLGSKRWQRILRNPKRFILIISVFVIISTFISALKHIDIIGLLCYDKISQKYALWSEDYFWSSEEFSRFMTFVVLPYQAIITWVLIILFTLLILLRLRPWDENDDSILFPPNSKSSDEIPSLHEERQQCPAQQDALRKRQKGQMRATKIVLVVAMLFGSLECMNPILSILQTARILTNTPLSRTLETIGNTLITVDSICNFVVFIWMMSYFRQLFVKIFLCTSINSNNNYNSSGTSQRVTS
ncbi:unnamed protein product [Trichobilharzia szidati]|nr:unnamed protein product [Trichobilharzia szidati]